MAIKSIIDVEIDRSGAFKAFQGQYARYQAMLAQSPAAWAKVNSKIDDSRKSFKELVDLEVAAVANQRLMAQAQAVALRVTRQQATAWQTISRDAKATSRTLADGALSLSKWALSIGAIGGLLGAAGGLFGITRLAQGVADQRRQSLGTGTTFGGARAFSTNFSRFADPEQLLGGVNSALTDPQHRASLYNAGLGEKELGGTTEQVGARLLTKLRDLARSTPKELLGAVYGSRGVSQFMSQESFQRLGATGDEEFAKQQSSFQRDQSSVGATDQDQRRWQDFTTQMTRAGNEIESVFIKGLAPLAEPLEKLSRVFSDAVQKFLGNKGVLELIDNIGKSIKDFDATEFGKSVTTIAAGFSKVASVMGYIVGDKNPIAAASNAALTGIRNSGLFGGVGGLAGAGFSKVASVIGVMAPGLNALALDLQKNAGLGAVTAADDHFHKNLRYGKKPSAHSDGRALDFRIPDPSKSAEVAERVRAELKRLGVKGTVLDEYKYPSKNATGGHIHVQTAQRVDVKVMNAAGGDIVVQTQQAAQ